MASIGTDEYEIPLRDQRYFGAGIKRKRVQFVPSTSTQAQTPSLPPPSLSSSAARRYLDIVLKDTKSPSPPTNTSTPKGGASERAEDTTTRPAQGRDPKAPAADNDPVASVCEICRRPIDDNTRPAVAHDSSLTHQICLQHSHPPSHLDRRRKGLQVLSSQGWDPDGRRGLGVSGEGILHPIKAVENREKAGLGLRPEDLARMEVRREKLVTLDAGKVRAMEGERRRRGERLRDAFYRSEDVERYLGDGGARREGVDVEAFRKVRENGLR